MNQTTVILFVVSAVIIVYICWQYWELTKFRVTHYRIAYEKITQELRVVVISDLHLKSFGKQNQRLLQAIRQQQPDLICIPGDIITSMEISKYNIAEQLTGELVQIAPVYFSNGNHESRVELTDSKVYQEYQQLKKVMIHQGVHILNNQMETVQIHGQTIQIYGVEIDLACYQKGKKIPLQPDFLENQFGKADADHFCLMLAHNPAYMKQYTGWGADLCLSGHYHGGLVCIPGIGSLISPQFQFFPKYSTGQWDFGKRHGVTSRGLGTHTFHIRIFNRAELPVLHILPENH